MKQSDYEKIIIHMVVYSAGKCYKCGKYGKAKCYDYGKLTARKLEEAMDESLYPVENILCSNCREIYRPQKMVYRDLITNKVMIETKIMFGNEIDEKVFSEQHNAHKERFDYFSEHEQEFWEKYEEFALFDWKSAIQELTLEEIKETYERLNYYFLEKQTPASYRKDIFARFKTDEEKKKFWREVNHHFIYEQLLDLGPIGWDPEDDIKKYGEKRVRFVYLNFPMDECMESVRTKYIGQVVRKEKGDNAFLFRRISQLTDEVSRIQRKVTSYLEQLDKERVEKAVLQDKLSDAYREIRKEREEKGIISRDPDDIENIQRLKSFITELKDEVKRLEGMIPESDKKEEIVILEEIYPIEETKQTDLSILNGKTVGIIGGSRGVQAKNDYPCTVLTHPGKPMDPEFYALLNKSDIIIVITSHVSHAAMWEAKYYAVERNRPIIFERNLNIPILLEKSAQRIDR